MKGQSSTNNSISEASSRRSSSSNSGVNHQLHCSTTLDSAVRGLLDYQMSPSDANVTFPHAVGHNRRTFIGENTNILALESDNINLGNNQVANGPLTMQNTRSGNIPQNVNAGPVNNGGQETEAGGYPNLNRPGATETEQVHSLGGSTDLSGRASLSTEKVNERTGFLGDGRRSSCKRKNIEGANPSSQVAENIARDDSPGPYNASGSLSISAPTTDPPCFNTPLQLDPGVGVGLRGLASDNPHAMHLAGTARRNSRIRSNPAYQQESSPSHFSLTETANRHSTIWSPDQFPWNGASDSRVGISSSSHVIPGERTMLIEEVDARIMQRMISEPSSLVPPVEPRNRVQDPSHWSFTNGIMTSPSIIFPASLVGSDSAAPQSRASIWESLQSPPPQHQQMSSEIIHRSSVTSSEPESGGQSHNFHPISLGPFSSQGMVVPTGANQLGNPPLNSYLPHPPHHHSHPVRHSYPSGRRGFWMEQVLEGADMDDDTSWLISSIRNASSAMHRGMTIHRAPGRLVRTRFEDVYIIEPPMIFAMPSMQISMRLEVDDMSYEDLLNLEDRMGDVQTGLSEEITLRYLKQRTYPSLRIGVPTEPEPCCICQEEFVNGERVGELDCGHVFHTGCITEWLKQKNVCPICKTTALVT